MTRNSLVRVGDVYAVPMADGRYGAVRVLRVEGPRHLIAVAPLLAPSIPSIDAPELRTILRQYRGMYRGDLALEWMEGGTPVPEMRFVGSIPPTGDEASLSVGYTARYWSLGIADAAVYEIDPHSNAIGPPDFRGFGPTVSGVIGPNVFWNVLGIYSEDHERFEAEAIARLSRRSVREIAGFQRMLAELLFSLDTSAHAHAVFGRSHDFSVDDFLYARCWIVAQGKKRYSALLRRPVFHQECGRFEGVLSIAERAHELKVGEAAPEFDTVDFETFSNKAGWLQPEKQVSG